MRVRPIILGLIASAPMAGLIIWQVRINVDQDLIKSQIFVLVMLMLLISATRRHATSPFRAVVTSILITLAGVSFWVENTRDVRRFYQNGEISRIWNVYHYYLGSKYFAELGYDGLYDYSCLADSELTNLFRDVTVIRDLRDLGMITRAQSIARARDGLKARFTSDRWAAFKLDFTRLRNEASARKWEQILRDRGYNPTPFWSVIGQAITARVDLGRPGHVLAMGSLDWVLILLAFGALGAAFGINMALAAFAVFNIHFVNDDRLIGGILQYDWFCAVLFSISWYHRGRTTSAAIALAYAACARVFPAFLLIGPLAFFIAERRRGRIARGQFPKFLVDFALASAIFMTIGTGTESLVGIRTEDKTSRKQPDLQPAAHRSSHGIRP